MSMNALVLGYAVFGAGTLASGAFRAVRRDPLVFFATDVLGLLLALVAAGVAGRLAV